MGSARWYRRRTRGLPAWLPGSRGWFRGSDGPLTEFVAEQIEKLLGTQIREIVGDFELADAGREAMTEIARASATGVHYTRLGTAGTEVEIQQIEQIKKPANASHGKPRGNLLDKCSQTVYWRIE